MRGALAGAAVLTLALSACAPDPAVFERTAAPATSAVTPSASRSTQPTGPASASASPEADGVECRSVAGAMPLADQVGQLFMVGVDTAGLDTTTRSAITSGRIGSVVLLGNTSAGSTEIRKLTAQLGSLGHSSAPLLIAVDQEGGTVQRLKGPGFTQIPSAREQGEWADGELREAAEQWGAELEAAGVHYNLAPVADVVPMDKRDVNEPIGKLRRDFGDDPGAVSNSVAEFIEGMHASGVMTSVKHFPGLGEVVTNTDFGAAEDTVIDRNSVAPFEAAIDAGVDSVMVSSAVFTRLDPDNEGVFSGVIMHDLLRDELGFDGVVIADDLGAAKSVSDVSPADRALRFVEAGGDLLINADPRLMSQMTAATVARAEEAPQFQQRVLDSAERVLRLKASAGLIDCQ